MQKKTKHSPIVRRITILCLVLTAAVLAAGCGRQSTVGGESDNAAVVNSASASSSPDSSSTEVSRLVDSGPNNDDTAPEPAAETNPGPSVEESVDDLLDDFDLVSDDGTAEQVRDGLAAALVPAGSAADDEALASAIAARLGADYQGEQDLGVLIEALTEELGETTTIESPEDLLAALERWGDTGVITFGPGAAAGQTITSSTSFEEAVRLIKLPGVAFDVLGGVRSFEIADVTIDVDEAARQIASRASCPHP